MCRVVLGDEANLARGLPGLVDHKIGHDGAVELAQGIGQHQARVIVADHRDENTARANCGNVACDVAGAADFSFVVFHR
jgi:hypothetical protein